MKWLDEERDPEFKEAVEFIIKTGQASASLIQRHFKIGYARAARLLDQLESYGVISECNGAKPRQILIKSYEEIESNHIPNLKGAENIPTLKWTKTVGSQDGFMLNLGTDESSKEVTVDLEKYGNVILIGSQMTNISELANQIIAQKVQEHSPDDLKLIIIDGFINQVEYPNGGPHLLTPIIRNTQKNESAIMWLQAEIQSRLRGESIDKNQSKILFLINGFNESIPYSFIDSEYRIGQIMKLGKSVGVYLVMTFDYIPPSLNKEILANNGAKVVFKPTTKQMGRSSGVPESIKLESPDQAILNTMYENKIKFTIPKNNSKKIYTKIFK